MAVAVRSLMDAWDGLTGQERSKLTEEHPELIRQLRALDIVAERIASRLIP